MDARTFLDLRATHNPNRWVLPVVPGLCTGNRFLFGGVGLGATIEAMEAVTGRPLIWATAQYLSYANPPSMMDIDVVVPVHGRATSQARAVAHVVDAEILTVNGALGRRPLEASGSWARMPDVPRPDDCGPRPSRWDQDEESIVSRMEVRLAHGRAIDDLDGTPSADGRAALWARMPGLDEPSAAALAILGDYVPFGIGQALGAMAGGNSLDNTLRVVRLVPTEWVLIDVRVDAVANGFGHGTVHLWAEDGTLLGTASQSTIVRYWAEADAARAASLAGRRSDDEEPT